MVGLLTSNAKALLEYFSAFSANFISFLSVSNLFACSDCCFTLFDLGICLKTEVIVDVKILLATRQG